MDVRNKRELPLGCRMLTDLNYATEMMHDQITSLDVPDDKKDQAVARALRRTEVMLRRRGCQASLIMGQEVIITCVENCPAGRPVATEA